MKTGRKDYGRGSRRLFRALLAGFFVLFLALLPLGAWPTLQEGAREDAISISEITAMRESEETAEEPSQSAPSGTVSKATSTEQLDSLLKAADGRRLNGDEATELYLTLVEARDEVKVARASSEAKSAEIADLKARLAAAEEEAGTKAYLMLDGIVGFEDLLPQFGVGVTLGTRIGSSLMLELGIDYDIGGIDGYNEISMDNLQFRCGIGWMF